MDYYPYFYLYFLTYPRWSLESQRTKTYYFIQLFSPDKLSYREWRADPIALLQHEHSTQVIVPCKINISVYKYVCGTSDRSSWKPKILYLSK